MKIRISILLALLFFSQVTTAEPAQSAVGVLEKNGTEFRPLFLYKNEKWIATEVDHEFPPSLNLAFDGKDYGLVKIKEGKILLSEAGKKLAKKFSKKDFGISFDVEAESRPFVLVSEEFFKDPDHWKPGKSEIDSSIKKQLSSAYLKIYGKDNCLAEAAKVSPAEIARMRPGAKIEKPKDGLFEVSFKYSEADIVFSGIYTSKTGQVVSLSMKKLLDNKCNFELTRTCSTFFVDSSKGHSLTNLTTELTNGCRELKLVEAGDFNGDGISEILFKDYDYNWDGYLMFDLKTKTTIRSGSSYH